MKSEINLLERKINKFNSKKNLQNEEFQKMKSEKTALDSQKKELEKLLIDEKAKVGNMHRELLKFKDELQKKNARLNECNVSMTDDIKIFSIFEL